MCDSVAILLEKSPHLLKRLFIPILFINDMKPPPSVANRVKTSVDTNLPNLLARSRHDIVPFLEGVPAVNESLHGFRVADAVLSNNVMREDFRDDDHPSAFSERFPCRRDVLENHSWGKSAIAIEQLPFPELVPCVRHEIIPQCGTDDVFSFVDFDSIG